MTPNLGLLALQLVLVVAFAPLVQGAIKASKAEIGRAHV